MYRISDPFQIHHNTFIAIVNKLQISISCTDIFLGTDLKHMFD